EQAMGPTSQDAGAPAPAALSGPPIWRTGSATWDGHPASMHIEALAARFPFEAFDSAPELMGALVRTVRIEMRIEGNVLARFQTLPPDRLLPFVSRGFDVVLEVSTNTEP